VFLLRDGMSGERILRAEVNKGEHCGFEAGIAPRSLYGEGSESRVYGEGCGGQWFALCDADEFRQVGGCERERESRRRSWLSWWRDAMHQMREGIGAFIAAMGINERWGNVSLAPPELRL
jgi:hypothetical protein